MSQEAIKILPGVRVRTQTFQITPKVTGVNRIAGGGAWTKIRLARRAGGDDFRVSTSPMFSFNGGMPIPVNRITTITLSPGESLYYRATSAANRVSVAVMGIGGIEGFDG